MARVKTVKLPVKGEEITFNAPTVGVVRAAMENKNEMAQSVAIIAKCCNLTEKEVDVLDISDFMVLNGVLKDFLPGVE
ncbi:MAG: phage tail assembly protein [Campylobacteraceae bacterium]|jgi:hypothetical protein|nr:phage tail assembly protein [Campylobacteraceae bacterium]